MNSKNLIIAAPEQIENLVKKSVKQALEKALPSVIRRSKLPKYIPTKILCRLTHWSPAKCFYLRKNDKIKYIQHGKSITYPTEWILEYLEAHSITPDSEVLKELEESDSDYFSKE